MTPNKSSGLPTPIMGHRLYLWS